MSLASHCASCGAPLNTGMQCSRSCHVTRGLVAAPRLVPVSSIKWSSDGEWISRLEADVARLTHRVAQLEAQLAEARAAVARLTTERAAVQSELENEKAMRVEDIADQRKEWERANAAESWREQAIQDIEALPRYAGVHDDSIPVELPRGDMLQRSAVLSIVRGSTP